MVVDIVGAAALAASLDALAYRGRLILVGDTGRSDVWPSLLQLAVKNATMCGMYISAELEKNRQRVWPMIEGLLNSVAEGELLATIDSTFALSDASAVHRRIESRDAFGRVVLIP